MIVASAFAALLTLSPALAQASPRRLFLFGGGDYPPPAMERLSRLSGGKQADHLIIPWASAEPAGYLESFRKSVGSFGPAAVEMAPSTAAVLADKAQFLGRLAKATSIHFIGGDQNRISDFLAKNPDLREALHRRYQEGAVFSGISAGAAIMSEIMITGEGDFSVIDASKVGTDKGLGLLTSAVVDQHFIAKRRENRLFGLILSRPDLVGLGVDEPAALLVEDERICEAIGPGMVMIVQAEPKTPSLALYLMNSGQRYDIRKKKPLL